MPTKPIQLDNKKWAIRACWTSPDGKQHKKYQSGFDRAKEAKDWAINYERQQKNLKSGSNKILVREFLAEWIKTKSKLSPNTLSGYGVNIDKINAVIGEMPLQELRLSHIQALIDAQEARANTTKYMYRTLHVALEWARKDKLIESNPSEFAELPEDDEPYKPTILDSDEIIKQLSALKSQDNKLYIPVLIAVVLGCRRGEALGLKWTNVDFNEGIAVIKTQYTRNGQKGATERKVKSKKSNRICALPDFLATELKEWKTRQVKSGSFETYVCAINGELPNLNTFTRRFNNFQTSNDFTKCRFHDLRHSFAMLQLERGTDIKTLSEMLGHAKTATTTDIYLTADIKLKKKAANKMDKLMGKKLSKNCLKIV